ncbi:Acetyltransferase (GNAT) family protein [compost metagenome]
MLFIAPGWQRQGIGTRLMNAALEHARVDVVTVKASLPSVPAYQRYGFTLAGEVGEFSGLVYQPMEKRLPTV